MEKDNITVQDTYGPANNSERIIAAIIDLVVAALIQGVFRVLNLHGLGSVLAAVYLIFRDSIPATGYQSLGKKLMKIKALHKDLMQLSALDGIKRNFIFLPNLLTALGMDFFYIGGGITLLLIILELYLIYADDNNQRMGDKFADTEVIALNKDLR